MFQFKFSIITVVKNDEINLEKTIKSIIKQRELNDVEYIVIDGKSNDRTVEIINKYKKHINKFISEPDKGIYDAMNKGLNHSTGDIIGIALDIDNLTLQFYKNGSTMGSQITGLPSGKTWFFASSGYGNTNTFDCNFGNGYFGSTQISSAGTNASGIGIFEYDVPSGYTALSTKGLNE